MWSPTGHLPSFETREGIRPDQQIGPIFSRWEISIAQNSLMEVLLLYMYSLLSTYLLNKKKSQNEEDGNMIRLFLSDLLHPAWQSEYWFSSMALYLNSAVEQGWRTEHFPVSEIFRREHRKRLTLQVSGRMPYPYRTLKQKVCCYCFLLLKEPVQTTPYIEVVPSRLQVLACLIFKKSSLKKDRGRSDSGPFNKNLVPAWHPSPKIIIIKRARIWSSATFFFNEDF